MMITGRNKKIFQLLRPYSFADEIVMIKELAWADEYNIAVTTCP